MRAIEQAVFTGLVWSGLYLDRVKLEAVPDILSKYADTPVIDCLPRVDTFIEDDGGDGDCGCLFCHIFLPLGGISGTPYLSFFLGPSLCGFSSWSKRSSILEGRLSLLCVA